MHARPPALGRPLRRGATLVETLVALVILGIAGVAILAGLQLSVTASDIHRKQTSGGAYVRGYAEAIETLPQLGPATTCSAPAPTPTAPPR